jgi:hypothetical protein
MPRDVIPFRAAPPGRTASTPDIAFAALPLLHKLRDLLAAAAPFRDACRRAEQRKVGRWGVPPLFFFDKAARAEWEADRPAGHRFPDPYAVPVARRYPAAAKAWADLRDLTDDALTLLAGAVEVRRAARAVPRLRAALADLAPDHPGCRRVADVLAVPDDEVILALHPAARAGFRVRLCGVADLFQFNVLLADAATGSPARGLLPGPRPDGRVVDAYRGGPVDPDADVAAARFQLYRPAALRPDGTLPGGFQAPEHWLWGHESPADVPAVRGEKVVLLGDPPYPRTWPVERRVPVLGGELELLDVLTAAAVEAWLRTLTGAEPAAAPARRAA